MTPDSTTVLMADEDLTGLLDIGATIKIARINHGLSGQVLGEMIQVSPQALRYWEDGSRTPLQKQRKKLDKALGTHLSTRTKGEKKA